MKSLSISIFASLAILGTSVFSKESNKDIVDTAVSNGSFKTLAAALGAAGLVDTLKGDGPFTVFAPNDEAFAKQIMKELLISVKYLHSKNIVHRDIKPENIMFEEKEVKASGLKLVDFGFATVLKYGTIQVNMKLGTPYYIAPEILNKKAYNFKCDIWSCGVVLYCMLAGRPPYNGESAAEIMCKIKLGNDKV